MIGLVLKPVPGSRVVAHETLYDVLMDGERLFRVRARRASHGEEKIKFCFRRELGGKTLDFDLETVSGHRAADRRCDSAGGAIPCPRPESEGDGSDRR